jgi:hypothetical protein
MGVLGVLGVGLFMAVVLILLDRTTYDTWTTLLIGPTLIALSLPALFRQAARENDKQLFWFLLIALFAKVVLGTWFRYLNTVDINGGTDSNKYHEAGLLIMENFRAGNFDTGLPHLTGTHFIRFFTGVLYTIIGPSRAGAFVIYSWLAFWGHFMFYKAFLVAVPDGRSRTYAKFVFFLPTLLFWPSSLGKEAWMLFSLGIAAYGVALLLRHNVGGLAIAGLGMWLAALVRPYMAGMVALGLAFAFVVRKRGEGQKQMSMFTKVCAVAILVLISSMLVTRTQEFLAARNVPTQALTSTLSEVSRRSTQGGSEFDPVDISNPVLAPVAFVTVIFRPFPTEAHTVRALISAVEGLFLLVLTIQRLPWIVFAFRRVRRQPYVLMAAIYIALFVFAFSSIGNFGILARQRSMVLPVYAVLLSLKPRSEAEAEVEPESADEPVAEVATLPLFA